MPLECTREGSCYSLASKDPKDATTCIRATVVMRPTATACLVSHVVSTICHAIPMLGKTTRTMELPRPTVTKLSITANNRHPCQSPTILPALPTRMPTLELLDARQNASPRSPRRGESGVNRQEYPPRYVWEALSGLSACSLPSLSIALAYVRYAVSS